jgi:uncharacterized protein YceK
MNPKNIMKKPTNLVQEVLESLFVSSLSKIVIIFAGCGSIMSTTSGIKAENIESTQDAQGQQAQSKQTASLSGELSSSIGTFYLYGFHFLNVN